MTDVITKLKVTQDYESDKSVMINSCQSSTSHSTVATSLKDKDKIVETVKGSVSPESNETNKNFKKGMSSNF